MRKFIKNIILIAILILIIISSLFLLQVIKDRTSDCPNHEPNYDDLDNDGRVTPCPEGCVVSSCYGIQTWCCPEGIIQLN